jgi:methionyl-tRNA formyltransferase
MNKPSIVFMGSPNAELSRRPFQALLDADYSIQAVVIPGLPDEPDPVPLDPPEVEDFPDDMQFVPLVSKYLTPGVITIAWEVGIPVIAIGNLKRPASQQVIRQLKPDLIVVSCYSKIIPPEILKIVPALNLHPSLLPRYRGPWPIFWQLKNGETKTGVTVHLVTDKVDGGDILGQRPVPFPDGIGGPEAEELCAETGSRLLLSVLDAINEGKPTRTPQAEAEASYQSLPSRADLLIQTDQPARQAFNFIRGAAPLVGEVPLEVAAGGEVFRTRVAVEYDPTGNVGAPFERKGEDVWVQFTPGVLHIKAM